MANIPRPAKVYKSQIVGTRIQNSSNTKEVKLEKNIVRKNNNLAEKIPIRVVKNKDETKKIRSEEKSFRPKFSFDKIDNISSEINKLPLLIESVKEKILLVIALMFFLAIILFIINLFKIEEIDCYFEGKVCVNEISSVAQANLIGQNLLFNDISKQIYHWPIMENQLSEIKVVKKLPSKLVIKLKAAPILYQLQLNDNNVQRVFTMNTNQVLQAFNWESEINEKQAPVLVELPELTENILSQNKVPTFYHLVLVELFELIRTNQLNNDRTLTVNRILINTDEKLILRIDDKINFVFDLTDINNSWQKMLYILENAKSNKLNEYEEIDLRFHSPVAIPKILKTNNSGQEISSISAQLTQTPKKPE